MQHFFWYSWSKLPCDFHDHSEVETEIRGSIENTIALCLNKYNLLRYEISTFRVYRTEIEQQLGYAEQSAYGSSHWTSARSGAFVWLVELKYDVECHCCCATYCQIKSYLPNIGNLSSPFFSIFQAYEPLIRICEGSRTLCKCHIHWNGKDIFTCQTCWLMV